MEKTVYLIRHAKSSWANAALDDFDRPLNDRGKRDAPEMGRRLARRGVMPQFIVSSPAKRAKKTAKVIADAIGYRQTIQFDDKLYFGSLAYYLDLLEGLFHTFDTVFVVGHNHTITEVAEYLTGRAITNIPTCGIVTVSYPGEQGFSRQARKGELMAFDYPKNKER